MEGGYNCFDKIILVPSSIMLYSVCFYTVLHLKYISVTLFFTFRASSSPNFKLCNSTEFCRI